VSGALQVNARERRTIMLALAILLLAILYAYVWRPWQKEIHDSTSRIAQANDDLRWMQSVVPQFKTLGVARAVGGPSLLAKMDDSVRAAGLSDALKRIEPVSGGAVGLRFERILFDVLIAWIEQLQTQGIRVLSMSCEQTGPGSVDVQIVVQKK
jgi:general secretion pathway protein M